MFIDNMQATYDGFSSDMQSSYRIWQQQSFAESKAAREAQSAAFWQGVAGAVVSTLFTSFISFIASFIFSIVFGVSGGCVTGGVDLKTVLNKNLMTLAIFLIIENLGV